MAANIGSGGHSWLPTQIQCSTSATDDRLVNQLEGEIKTECENLMLAEYYRLPPLPSHEQTLLPRAFPMPDAEIEKLFKGRREQSMHYARWDDLAGWDAVDGLMANARTICRDLLVGTPFMPPPVCGTRSPFDMAGAVNVTFNAMLHSHNPEIGLSSVCVTMDVQPSAASLSLPIDVFLLIDTSGSMAGERFEAAKRAIKMLARTLNPNDRLSLVTFGDDEITQLPLNRLDEVNLDRCLDGLRANGHTTKMFSSLVGSCLAALETGEREELQRAKLILFLTDGATSDVQFTPETSSSIKFAIDTLGGGNAENLVICPIGINLDRGYTEHLQLLAEKTGGLFFDGSSCENLPVVFEKARKRAFCKSLQIAPASTVTFRGTWKVVNVWHDGDEAAKFSSSADSTTVSRFSLNAIPNNCTASVTFQLAGSGPLAAKINLVCNDVIYGKRFVYSPSEARINVNRALNSSVISRIEYINYRAQMRKMMAITGWTPADSVKRLEILHHLKSSISTINLPLIVNVVKLINAMENVLESEKKRGRDLRSELKAIAKADEDYGKDEADYVGKNKRDERKLSALQSLFSDFFDSHKPLYREKFKEQLGQMKRIGADRLYICIEDDEAFNQRKEDNLRVWAIREICELPRFKEIRKRVLIITEDLARRESEYQEKRFRFMVRNNRRIEIMRQMADPLVFEREMQLVREGVTTLLQYHISRVYHASQHPASVKRIIRMAMKLQESGRFSFESGSAAESALAAAYKEGIYIDKETCIRLLVNNVGMVSALAGIVADYTVTVPALRATTQGANCLAVTYMTPRTAKDTPSAGCPVGSLMIKSNSLRGDCRVKGKEEVDVLCPQDADDRLFGTEFTVEELLARIDNIARGLPIGVTAPVSTAAATAPAAPILPFSAPLR